MSYLVLVCGFILAHFCSGCIAQDIVFEDSQPTQERNYTTLLTRDVMDTTTLRTESEHLPEQAKKCGVSKEFSITPLITNGTEAHVGTFPWHAAIYHRTEENNGKSWQQTCGGSLITDRFVLTAAHCVKDVSEVDIRVALGKYFRSWDHYEITEQKRNVSKIAYPDEFNTNRLYYFDLALLLLDEKIMLGEFIMPVCTGLHIDSTHLLNKTLFVFGWGKTTTELTGSRSETLLYNDGAMIMPRETCKTVIPKWIPLFDRICIKSNNPATTQFQSTFSSNPNLTISLAGHLKPQACQSLKDDAIVQPGDSGGGMTVKHGGLHYILGISSSALRDSQSLTLITNISWSNHSSWIQKEVGKYDTSFRWSEDDEATNHSSRDCLLPDNSPTRKFCRLTSGCEDCDSYTMICHAPSGSRVDQVKVVCAPGYKTETSDIAVCVDRAWHPPISKCLKLCPPLVSETLLLKCRYGNEPVPCSHLAQPGTIVSFECQSSFSEDSDSKRQGIYRNIITCLKSGEWSANLTFCKAGCGVSTEVKKFSPTIVSGKHANIGFFPWHAGLYYHMDKDGKTSWDQKCGGSLITDRVVLTAAHCLVDVTDVNNLRVALGKYHRSWDTIEPTEEKRNVSEIASPSEFNRNILSFDIALVLLSERIKLGEYIMPVCLDYGEGTNHLHNSKLYVVGWGKISSTIQAQSSENLLYNTVTVMSQNACRKALPFFYSTYEKFCAVNDNSESVTQQGDSGGGLTAVYDEGLHYIVGVVSAKVEQTSLFTNVKYKTHTEWINFKIRQFANK